LTTETNIDLWFWSIEAQASDLARWQTYLSDDELGRMARFLFERDRVRFTICRSRMRRVLGWYSRTEPRHIEFAAMGRQKPVLAGSNTDRLEFNLTHTDGLACLVVTHGHGVGVDLERVRHIEDDFIAYSLNPAEHSFVLALEPALHQIAFFRVWTAKEAYLKAIGAGLWQSLKTFDVDVPAESAMGTFIRGKLPRIDDAGERARNWHLYSFRATDHHIGALAIAPPRGTELKIRTRWLGAAPSMVSKS
jgi:4'-phosphopantetheinyl transferase